MNWVSFRNPFCYLCHLDSMTTSLSLTQKYSGLKKNLLYCWFFCHWIQQSLWKHFGKNSNETEWWWCLTWNDWNQHGAQEQQTILQLHCLIGLVNRRFNCCKSNVQQQRRPPVSLYKRCKTDISEVLFGLLLGCPVIPSLSDYRNLDGHFWMKGEFHMQIISRFCEYFPLVCCKEKNFVTT